MKRTLISLAVILLAAAALAQPRTRQEPVVRDAGPLVDTVFFTLPDEITDTYLDSTGTGFDRIINDYLLVGFHGGVVFNNTLFNPTWTTQFDMHAPVYGASLILHGKLFGFMPYFGLELGIQHTYEGYHFAENKNKQINRLEGVEQMVMEVWEVPLLMSGHADLGETFKLLGKVGIFGGYRMNVERTGPYNELSVYDTMKDGTTYYPSDYDHSFRDFDYRWTYGLEGGVGFGIMLAPFEIHINALAKWGWGSYFEPDYVERFSYVEDKQKYLWRRFGYPLDVMLTAGIYYQVTPRRGYSRHQLKKIAKQIVYGE